MELAPTAADVFAVTNQLYSSTARRRCRPTDTCSTSATSDNLVQNAPCSDSSRRLYSDVQGAATAADVNSDQNVVEPTAPHSTTVISYLPVWNRLRNRSDNKRSTDAVVNERVLDLHDATAAAGTGSRSSTPAFCQLVRNGSLRRSVGLWPKAAADSGSFRGLSRVSSNVRPSTEPQLQPRNTNRPAMSEITNNTEMLQRRGPTTSTKSSTESQSTRRQSLSGQLPRASTVSGGCTSSTGDNGRLPALPAGSPTATVRFVQPNPTNKRRCFRSAPGPFANNNNNRNKSRRKVDVNEDEETEEPPWNGIKVTCHRRHPGFVDLIRRIHQRHEMEQLQQQLQQQEQQQEAVDVSTVRENEDKYGVVDEENSARTRRISCSVRPSFNFFRDISDLNDKIVSGKMTRRISAIDSNPAAAAAAAAAMSQPSEQSEPPPRRESLTVARRRGSRRSTTGDVTTPSASAAVSVVFRYEPPLLPVASQNTEGKFFAGRPPQYRLPERPILYLKL